MPSCLVHLASGIGNIVLATPMLVALDELGFEIDVCLDADYAQTVDLLRPWSVVRSVSVGGIAAAMRAVGHLGRSATTAIVVKSDAQNAGSSPDYSCGPLADAVVQLK